MGLILINRTNAFFQPILIINQSISIGKSIM